ncbi:TetR/AcrR family transcriptional regulator [Aequoribacter sp.]|uniref:TetR/AcrR family transcriptional regulator n=1 Tax=Aequoribacter sp. TaxID=2847771 RepID=UPI003F695192
MPASSTAASSYHHGNLREALIDSAEQAIVEQAAEAMSLRALARNAGVSQTAPYRHFSDRNTLLAAVSERGYQRLIKALLGAIDSIDDNAERQVREAARCYVQFAIDNPQLFKLMFGPLLQPTLNYPALHARIRECNHLVQTMLANGIGSGSFREDDIRYLTNTAWAGIHGLATLVIDMPELFEQHIELERQMDVSVRSLLNCMQETRC